jgi:hypothetical protein
MDALFVKFATQSLRAFFAEHNLGDAAPAVAQLDAFLVEDSDCPLHDFPPPILSNPSLLLSSTGLEVFAESSDLIKIWSEDAATLFGGRMMLRFASLCTVFVTRMFDVYGTTREQSRAG